MRRAAGATRHFSAHISDGSVVRGEELPAPEWVEIVPADGAFHLLYVTASGAYVTDTWHQTLAQAKAQAQHEFEIVEADWHPVAAQFVAETLPSPFVFVFAADRLQADGWASGGFQLCGSHLAAA